MKKPVSYLGSLVVALSSLVAVSVQQTAQAHGTEKVKPKAQEPVVFQAGGPSAASIQSMVEGLAATFNNPSYATAFKAFSPVRLFSPLDSNVTTAHFFVPGGGEVAATTKAFGAVFSDVDQQDGKSGHGATTSLLFYGAQGDLLYRAEAPASQGEASFSFLGVLFDEARVAFVRIRTGNTVPGTDDSRKRDVVMMDDFIYGEPQAFVASGHLAAPDGN